MNNGRPNVGVTEGMQMASSRESTRLPIRGEAERFLGTYGFSTPPLPSDQALAARKLVVAQLSLDDLLIRADLPPEDSGKIQAMLDANERTVAFRNGLPTTKRHWGALHEVGHEFIPWQSDILYHCPLLWLPDHLQEQFEAEADMFAAEAFFFGKQFHKRAYTGDFGLKTAMELATSVYKTSFHATFKHYVEESPLPRCLLIWKREEVSGPRKAVGGYRLHYFVKSDGFRWHVDADKIRDPEGAVAKVVKDPWQGVVSHDMILMDGPGHPCVARAESFSNSYNAFTLISPPQHKPVYQVAAGSPKDKGRNGGGSTHGLAKSR